MLGGRDGNAAQRRGRRLPLESVYCRSRYLPQCGYMRTCRDSPAANEADMHPLQYICRTLRRRLRVVSGLSCMTSTIINRSEVCTEGLFKLRHVSSRNQATNPLTFAGGDASLSAGLEGGRACRACSGGRCPFKRPP
ncbi:hypothetical protein CALVIDRAFT_533936 [Calocera viscosa TUFC12733]|uniref:Uncharacterized protein n=1 Tax=Calocera viscosa (strain TUFC12733) TaxID=1330018 RepID=A0A167QVK9_CALVF|nr:hypothetical protein CALVIDRAFT_533936 [Calocera viscosa TUFC12733]